MHPWRIHHCQSINIFHKEGFLEGSFPCNCISREVTRDNLWGNLVLPFYIFSYVFLQEYEHSKENQLRWRFQSRFLAYSQLLKKIPPFYSKSTRAFQKFVKISERICYVHSCPIIESSYCGIWFDQKPLNLGEQKCITVCCRNLLSILTSSASSVWDLRLILAHLYTCVWNVTADAVLYS